MMNKQELRKVAIALATADDLIRLLEEKSKSEFTRGRARAARHNIQASIGIITSSVRKAHTTRGRRAEIANREAAR